MHINRIVYMKEFAAKKQHILHMDGVATQRMKQFTFLLEIEKCVKQTQILCLSEWYTLKKKLISGANSER